MSTRLKTIYDKEIVSNLMSKLSLKNKHEVPKIEKIILNMGLRLPIWKINFCSSVLQLSEMPRCKKRPQTAIFCS